MVAASIVRCRCFCLAAIHPLLIVLLSVRGGISTRFTLVPLRLLCVMFACNC
jgi:hypothetical protein